MAIKSVYAGMKDSLLKQGSLQRTVSSLYLPTSLHLSASSSFPASQALPISSQTVSDAYPDAQGQKAISLG